MLLLLAVSYLQVIVQRNVSSRDVRMPLPSFAENRHLIFLCHNLFSSRPHISRFRSIKDIDPTLSPIAA